MDIMWYGIIITCGMVIAAVIVYLRAPRHNLSGDNMLTLAIIVVPAGVIGARAYYVLFNWDIYKGDIAHILNFRGGGLAIHGGLILGIIAGIIVCLVMKQHPLNVMDLCAPAVALAQAIGRWGNYFNSEAHGGLTDLPWGVVIDGHTYHPTFLYESIWCFILFFILLYVDNHRKFQGQVLLLYGILYSAERVMVESLRTDSLMIGPLKQAQVISLVIIIVCVIFYVILRKKQIRRS
ncbi:MAG: prolipoprotein diacylglyceryl transferase [Clostridia bacterium]|nr:prolipoprotein diacylglyceryl transferase [Clostridia bacterium]